MDLGGRARTGRGAAEGGPGIGHHTAQGVGYSRMQGALPNLPVSA